MRQIKSVRQFKKDFKRVKGDIQFDQDEFQRCIELIRNFSTLDPKYEDHPLKGDYKGFRAFHLSPDIVVIYFIDKQEIILARIGSHSNLFGK